VVATAGITKAYFNTKNNIRHGRVAFLLINQATEDVKSLDYGERQFFKEIITHANRVGRKTVNFMRTISSLGLSVQNLGLPLIMA
jgi:hypothetical protein